MLHVFWQKVCNLFRHNQIRALFLILFCQSMLQSQVVTLPESVKGNPSTFIQVTAKTEGKDVVWYSPDNLNVLPSNLLKDSKTIVVMSPTAGKFRLVAWSAKGDIPGQPTIMIVEIGNPTPIDNLTGLLTAAYSTSTESNKAELKKLFVAFYKTAALTVVKPEIHSMSDLQSIMQSAATTMSLSGKLINVQKIVADQLGPATQKPFENKTDIVDLLNRVASILEGVKE